ASARKDREAGEETLLFRREELMAPFDRRSQCLLAGLCVAASFQEVEALGNSVEDLSRGEHAGASGGQLDGQGQVVEPRAQLGELLARVEPGALAEELDRLGRGQGRHGVLALARDAQKLPRGDEQ